MKIAKIFGRKLLASQGNATVEAEVSFFDGKVATASVPAGISAGRFEIPKVSAEVGVEQINRLGKLFAGQEISQQYLDEELKKTDYGGNATLAVSAAFWRASSEIPQNSARKFPQPLLLMFEGGEHGNANITIQEFMLKEEDITSAISDFQLLKKYLSDNQIEETVGAEGGFSPNSFDNQKILTTLKTIFPDRKIALDVAGTFQKGTPLDFDSLLSSFPIFSVEDPFGEDDWESWIIFTRKFGEKILVVGDDLTTTNPQRIKSAIEKKAINAVIIKPNQNGTISGTLEAVKIARDANLKVLFSHRGEETDDTWLVDLAIFASADYIKLGGMDRGERIAKYNRLLELGMP